ncbi:MAG: hypothetical protein PHD51_02540 [Patescibacteria group bacterium]|nr:hypothetical protein [Patescibacteria group bacterium]MDD5490264.1 hypothetical protein [Patescibacteria group bacterium]
MPEKTPKKLAPSTQKFLDISEIRDDCVILKDGTLRAVLLASSINFALKSEDEQNALISAYMSFLNSFDFPLQIVIQSRKLDIEGYLERLKDTEKTQTNELLKIQIADYREFIAELVEIGDIMSKSFYVVIPYNPLTDKRKGFWTRAQELFTPAIILRLGEDKFQKRRHYLIQRVGHIQSGLESIGLHSQLLDTQSLIELYYNAYNPATSKVQKLVEISKLQVED